MFAQNVVIDNARAPATSSAPRSRRARSPTAIAPDHGGSARSIRRLQETPCDALRDFAPIRLIANSGGLVIVVHPSFGAKTLQQLIDMARGAGKIVFARPATATAPISRWNCSRRWRTSSSSRAV
jgi:hypothetical protein